MPGPLSSKAGPSKTRAYLSNLIAGGIRRRGRRQKKAPGRKEVVESLAGMAIFRGQLGLNLKRVRVR